MSPVEVWLFRLGAAMMLGGGVVIAVLSDSVVAPVVLVGFTIGLIWRLPPHQRRQVIGF